jgi:hypothetical protein
MYYGLFVFANIMDSNIVDIYLNYNYYIDPNYYLVIYF